MTRATWVRGLAAVWVVATIATVVMLVPTQGYVWAAGAAWVSLSAAGLLVVSAWTDGER